MDAQVDRGVLELHLAAAVLELELRADAHEIADARVREQVEPLGFKPRLIAPPIDPLPACVRFGIASNGRQAAEAREVWLVIHAATHERTFDGVLDGRVA